MRRADGRKSSDPIRAVLRKARIQLAEVWTGVRRKGAAKELPVIIIELSETQIGRSHIVPQHSIDVSLNPGFGKLNLRPFTLENCGFQSPQPISGE